MTTQSTRRSGRIIDMPKGAPPPLNQTFFAQPTIPLARALLSTIMVRKVGPNVRRARIVETEAYLGPRDLASHASKGRTKRTEVMFGPPGRAYVYFIYGMYEMFNIVAGTIGDAHAILIRAAEPLDGWEVDLTGPGKLARAFAITREDNGMDLTGNDIHFLTDPSHRPRIIRAKRVNIGYAKHWQRRLLRFIDRGSPVARKLKF